MSKTKIFSTILLKTAFYGQDTELEPEPELVKSRNRNQCRNLSKVRSRTGTRTVKNSYGSPTLGVGLKNVVDRESGFHTLLRTAGLSCTVPCDCSPPRPPTDRTELHAYQTACSRIAHDLNQKPVLRIRMFLGLPDPDH